MLTNEIPIERVFHNDKMWYEYVGVNKKGKPMIEEVPNGGKSCPNNKYYRLSDNKEELYNYWVNVLANKSDYEKMNEKYSKLLKELDKKYKKVKEYRYDWGVIPLFQYYQALNSVGEITKQQMLDGIIAEIETILTTLTVGKVMSEWSKDAQWTHVIASVKYDKCERILKINCVSFFAMCHYTRELHEDVYDLKTEAGFYKLGKFLSYDRGNWRSLNELIENYEQHIENYKQHIAKIKDFISNVKKINSKKEKLYGKN